MALITYTDKANLNSLPTVNAENKVSDTDMNEIKSIVNGINNQIKDYFAAKNKELWTGSWSSGTISVDEIQNYSSFICFVDTSDPIYCVWNSAKTRIVGVNSFGTNTSSQYIKSVNFEVSGTTLSSLNAREVGHSAGGNHTSGSAKTVSKIIGVEPIITWT